MGLTATELQTRMERLQTIADNLPAIIAYWDKHERCQFANRACLSWMGRDPTLLLGLPLRNVIGEAMYKLNKPHIDAVLRGEPQSFERSLVDVKGASKATQTSYVPDVQDGVVQGFFVLINDMSASKRAEAAALESRVQLEALLDAVPEYIFSLDRAGKILFANRTLLVPVESVLGNTVQQYFPDEYRDLAARAIREAFEDGRANTFESVVTLGDEGKRWFQCQFVPVPRTGATTSVLLLSRDVTEHRQMELQLLASERLAAVGALAAGVAHEINTPVQYVGDSVEFLHESSAELFPVLDKLLALHRAGEDQELRKQLGAEVQAMIDKTDLEYLITNVPQAIDRALDGLRRVTEIVRSLKAFSHLDQKQLVDAQLNQVIDTALTLAANEYKYVAEIVRDYADSPVVRCHVGGISQVILNIVVNAAHAIADKVANTTTLGRITIGTRDEGEHALITISDTGAGVPENIRSRIFAPFFTTKPVGKGTGQGLAISWTIVTQEHRGQLWFESQLGVGTTFYIRIPKDPEQPVLESDVPPRTSAVARRAGSVAPVARTA